MMLIYFFPGSSKAERYAVNVDVVGSSPTQGANKKAATVTVATFLLIKQFIASYIFSWHNGQTSFPLIVSIFLQFLHFISMFATLTSPLKNNLLQFPQRYSLDTKSIIKTMQGLL